MKLHHAISCTGLALALAGCGGGGYSSEPTPTPVVTNEVPSSATASTAAYTSYAGSLKSSETADPLDVSKVVNPPTSETESPVAI